ncbi:MAG TPA: hypothetical protein PKN11_10190, partial [Anaerolineaceae bacterium]|nr:hypothetical protein [Anaerolineaceae bacterium]
TSRLAIRDQPLPSKPVIPEQSYYTSFHLPNQIPVRKAKMGIELILQSRLQILTVEGCHAYDL